MTRRKVKACLDADDPVGAVVGQRDSGGVGRKRKRTGRIQSVSARVKLRLRDVQRDQAARTRHLADDHILGSEAVGDVDDVGVGGELGGQGRGEASQRVLHVRRALAVVPQP